VAGNQLLEGLLQSPHPLGLAVVADHHSTDRDAVEGLTVSQRETQDGVLRQFLLNVRSLLLPEDIEQFSAEFHIFDDEKAILFVAGDRGETSNIYRHFFLYLELLALQALRIFPLGGL
jgi:hypothetical protein